MLFAKARKMSWYGENASLFQTQTALVKKKAKQTTPLRVHLNQFKQSNQTPYLISYSKLNLNPGKIQIIFF